MAHTSQAITKKDLDDLGDRLSAAIASNSAEVHRLGFRRRFDRREDLDAIERRVTEIEQQLAKRPM